MRSESRESWRIGLRVYGPLVRREWARHVRSVRFVTFTLVAVGLVPAVIFPAAAEFKAAAEYTQRLENQRDALALNGKAPLMGTAVQPTLSAVRRLTPASIIVRGVDRSVPAVFDFAPSGVQPGPSLPSMVLSRLPDSSFDLEAVIRVVLGLLALTLSAEVLAVDRTDGTLHTLQTQPASSFLVFMAKLTGGYAAVAVPLFAVMASALASLYLWARPLVTAELILVLVLITITGLLYVAAMLSLGVWIGVRASSNSSVAAAALSTGLVLSLATIPLAESAAALAAPAISQREAADRARDLFDRTSQRLSVLLGERFGQIAGKPEGWQLAEERPEVRSEIETRWRAETAALRASINALTVGAEASRNRQSAIGVWLALLGPGSAFNLSAAAIAGTGGAAAARWDLAAGSYQRMLETRLFDNVPRILMRVPEGGRYALQGFDRHPVEHVGDVPPFMAPIIGVGLRARDALPAVVSLVSVVIIAVLAGYWEFRRLMLSGPVLSSPRLRRPPSRTGAA